MRLSEVIVAKAHYVGSCKNSFDSDSQCVISQLPWSDVTDFAQHVEDAAVLTRNEFLRSVVVPSHLSSTLASHDCNYGRTDDGVFFIFDEDTDTHYFFVD